MEDKNNEVKDVFYDHLDRLFEYFSLYNMKVVRNFNALSKVSKVCRLEILIPIMGSLYMRISNNNGLRVVNFATSDLRVPIKWYETNKSDCPADVIELTTGCNWIGALNKDYLFDQLELKDKQIAF